MGRPRFALIFLIGLVWSSPVWAGQRFNAFTGRPDLCVTVVEEDGSPSATGCQTIEVTNGTLTDDGDGAFSLSTGGGGGNSFETIDVPAGTDPVADSSTDTLTITETTFLTITGTAGTDTIDITQVTTDIGTDGLIAANAVALTTDTTGNYVADVADGTGIDGTAAAEGATYTPSLDLTEITCGTNLTCSAATTINVDDASSFATSVTSPIFSSNNADPADAGIVRLGNAENIAWEASPAGTDCTLGVSAAELLSSSCDLATTLDLTVTGGDITLGTTSIFSGGDTASLNNVDAVDATTESTIEAAIDTLANLSQGGLADDAVREADLMAVDAAADEECLTFETTTGDFEWQTCGSGTDTNANWKIDIPGYALAPLEAADSIPPLSKDTGTNLDTLTADFDQSTDEGRKFTFELPSDATSGTVTFTVWWSSTVTSGNVIWDFRHNGGIAEGTTWDSALTTVAAAADAVQGTTDQVTKTSITETIANLGWSAGEFIEIMLYRDADNGSDTLAGDARVHLVHLEGPRA